MPGSPRSKLLLVTGQKHSLLTVSSHSAAELASDMTILIWPMSVRSRRHMTTWLVSAVCKRRPLPGLMYASTASHMPAP